MKTKQEQWVQANQVINQAANDWLKGVETDNLDEVFAGFASMARMEIAAALAKGTLIIHNKQEV